MVLRRPVERLGGFKMGSKADGGGAMRAAEEGSRAIASPRGVAAATNRYDRPGGPGDPSAPGGPRDPRGPRVTTE